MSDINITLDETVEIDTVIKKLKKSKNNIEIEDRSDYDLSVLQTQTGIFNPKGTGEYQLKINGQELTINVTDSNSYTPDSSIAHLKLNGTTDDSIGQYSFINNGAEFTSDSVKGSKALDLSNGYISYPSPIVRQYNNSGWSISLMFKTSNSNQYIYQESDFGSNYSRYANFGASKYENRDGGGSYSNFNYTINNYKSTGYNQLVCTWDGDKNKANIYFNSKPIKSSSVGEQINSEKETRIGNGYSGLVDDVIIMNKKLSGSEVSELYEKRY